MRGVARVGAALARSGGLRSAAGRGVDLVSQVSDTAAELIRTRRDPAVVAGRRRVAARRRLAAWSVVALVLAAIGATMLVGVIDGGASATSIGGLVLVTGLLVYALISVVGSSIDLRARTLAVRRLPAPQPRRRAVAGPIRPLIARLDGYSDALRQAVGLIGIAPANADMRAVRDQTVTAADAAEVRLRGQAAELTAMLRGGRPAAGTEMAATCERLRREVAAGVDQYGRLVAAATDAASASADLAVRAAPAGGLDEVTDRLTALAAGMRAISTPSAPRARPST